MKKQAYVIIAITSLSSLSFFFPTACWKSLTLTGLFSCTMSKNRKIYLFIVGIQHVHDLSLIPVFGEVWKSFL